MQELTEFSVSGSASGCTKYKQDADHHDTIQFCVVSRTHSRASVRSEQNDSASETDYNSY